ncbi:MAG: hypothetical protein QFE16_15725 [Pseudomonadota bacterium]|nr:hypothetical protein [Pseudomonadota bacterium]
MKRSWIHEAVRTGRFPAPVIQQPRCTRWKLSHVRAWLIEQTEKSASDTETAEMVKTRAKKGADAAARNRAERAAAAGAAQ